MSNVYHVPYPPTDDGLDIPEGMIPDYSAYKIPGCRHTETYTCRGCEYSLSPELSDGGCKLLYGDKG